MQTFILHRKFIRILLGLLTLIVLAGCQGRNTILSPLEQALPYNEQPQSVNITFPTSLPTFTPFPTQTTVPPTLQPTLEISPSAQTPENLFSPTPTLAQGFLTSTATQISPTITPAQGSQTPTITQGSPTPAATQGFLTSTATQVSPTSTLTQLTPTATQVPPTITSTQIPPTATQISPTPTTAPTPVANRNLLIPPNGEVLQGVWLPVNSKISISAIQSFNQKAEYPVGAVLYYVAMAPQAWGWTEAQLNIADQNGLIMQIVWEPWLKNYGNPLKAILAGKVDNLIDSFAQGAAKFGKPFFLRFAHEMNGNWYPWSGVQTGSDPELYKQAWIYVWQRFQQAGATNVVWVWSPNAISIPSQNWNDLSAYYPGAAYVDWVGVDFYGLKWGDNLPGDMLDEVYTLYARQHPIMIAETAASDPASSSPSATLTKPLWIDKLFAILPFSPQVKAVFWFNEIKEADWRIDSNPVPQALDAYRRGWQNLRGK